MGIILSSIVYEYYKNNLKLKKSMVFLTVMGLFVVWEIYEFLGDSFFGFQMQGLIRNGIFLQSPIQDTMFDLIFGALGSILFFICKRDQKNPAPQNIKKFGRGFKKLYYFSVNSLKFKEE